MDAQEVTRGLGKRSLKRLAETLGGQVLHADGMAGNVVRLRMSTTLTRLNGMQVCAYRVGNILVDSGLAYLGPLVRAHLADHAVEAIALTHHHEDHCGNAGAVASDHHAPVYLRNAASFLGEGVVDLKPYRVAWWGQPHPYQPLEMPARVEAGGRALTAIPIPGHSSSHTALLEEATGVVFTGDLFVSRGATAVMDHENPYENASSLRKVAELRPRWMLTGHALAIENPAPMLEQKAEAIERAAVQVLEHHARGLSTTEIVRRVFPRGNAKDRLMAAATQEEFSRANFVRACIHFAP